MSALDDEIAGLARRYGSPRTVEATIATTFDPISRRDRIGEVCFVIRRRNGKVLLSIKTFYPRGAYRLPTGGIDHGESILDAVRRETREETGLDTEIRRFLAAITYRDVEAPGGDPVFRTFAFLLDETGGELGTLDAHEQIEDWIEVEPGELGNVARRLEGITDAQSDDIGGKWSDWGRFRAIVHRVVDEELALAAS